MSVLLIGCGYWGTNWAKALTSMGKLGAICDARPQIQAELKSKYPQATLFTELSEALKHPGIESAVISTPVITHCEVARQCLLAGKHALVEKPLTMVPEESEFLVKLAEGGGLIIAVGHLLLYHPALVKLKSLIDVGELGEILNIQCTRVNLGKVRNEENVWWSLAPHDLSIISMLLEEPLTLQSATGMALLKRPGIEDTVQVNLLSQSGCAASIQVSWLSPVKKHETIVIGSRAMAIFDDALPAGQKLRVLEYQLDQHGQQINGIQRGETRVIHYDEPKTDLLSTQAQAFIDATKGQRASLPNDGRNGLQVVQLLAEAQAQMDQARALQSTSFQAVHT
jgi:UDP-2-acetamido-3-amino-2,3-dideoxy-glucuronate N-acetyltransferase